jgi:hypothetical protein
MTRLRLNQREQHQPQVTRPEDAPAAAPTATAAATTTEVATPRAQSAIFGHRIAVPTTRTFAVVTTVTFVHEKSHIHTFRLNCM